MTSARLCRTHNILIAHTIAAAHTKAAAATIVTAGPEWLGGPDRLDRSPKMALARGAPPPQIPPTSAACRRLPGPGAPGTPGPRNPRNPKAQGPQVLVPVLGSGPGFRSQVPVPGPGPGPGSQVPGPRSRFRVPRPGPRSRVQAPDLKIHETSPERSPEAGNPFPRSWQGPWSQPDSLERLPGAKNGRSPDSDRGLGAPK